MKDDDGKNLSHPDQPLTADDIRWRLVPSPRTEDLPFEPFLALDWEALALYAYELQADLRSTRQLLHEALGAVTHLTTQLDRAKHTVRTLSATVRELRQAA